MLGGGVIKKVQEILADGERREGVSKGIPTSHFASQSAMAYSNTGNFYRFLGQPERAIRQFNEAIRLDPQFALAYAYRALSYTLLNMDPEAGQDVDRAAEHGMNPTLLEQEIDRLKQQRSMDHYPEGMRTRFVKWPQSEAEEVSRANTT